MWFSLKLLITASDIYQKQLLDSVLGANPVMVEFCPVEFVVREFSGHDSKQSLCYSER